MIEFRFANYRGRDETRRNETRRCLTSQNFIAGFAARELAARIDHAEPKVLITASCGLEPNKLVE